MIISIYTIIRTKVFLFSKSILYYPVIFLLVSFLLFLCISNIDQTIQINFKSTVFNPLIFTGSPDASRSILSVISTGWTTILGVTFSLTLITLQLASSRYNSRLINEFQNDKINQFTIAWFIFVSSFSLLTLKTVRTEDSNEIFIPILGTNVAIVIALTGLLIFIIYVHNISNYLRPNILVTKLVDKIIDSLTKYENRSTDEKLLTEVNNEKSFNKPICNIYSDNEGIITSINWNAVEKHLVHFDSDSDLWIEMFKNVGDWVSDKVIIATLYEYNNKEYEKNDNIKSNINTMKQNKDKEYLFNEKILSSISITNDSNLSDDPILGVRLLGELASKSSKLRDYDVINSILLGLFRILSYIYLNNDKLGLPFVISKTNEKYTKIRKIRSKKKDENNEVKKNSEKRIIIINPRELRVQDVIFHILSYIDDTIVKTVNSSSSLFLCNQYIYISSNLLNLNKKNEFKIITEWYSRRLFLTIKRFPDTELLDPLFISLSNFKKDLKFHYPYATKIFSVYMDKTLESFQENKR